MFQLYNELPETYEDNNECIESTTIKIQVHDIVAVSQSVSATSVMPGYMVTITGLLRNDGTETETFTVRCYYGRPEIPPVQIGSDLLITLEPNEETTVSFYWDTSGVTPGTYWIEIRALPVLGELDTDDNTCTVETPVTIKAYYVGGEIVTAPVINLLNMIVVAILLIAALATTIMLLRRPMLVPKNK